jgi:hypothetical protein
MSSTARELLYHTGRARGVPERGERERETSPENIGTQRRENRRKEFIMVRIMMRVGRDESLLAGRETHGEIVVDVPVGNLSDSERSILTRYAAHHEGADYSLASGVYIEGQPATPPASAIADEAAVHTAIAHIAATAAMAAAKKAADAKEAETERLARQTVLRAFLADKSARAIVDNDHEVHIKNVRFYPSAGDLESQVHDAAVARRDADTTRDAAAKQTWAQEEAAAEARKHEQLTEAVTRLGSDLQRERWEAGVMPVAESIALVEGEALLPLRDAGLSLMPANEEHLDSDDIEHAENCGQYGTPDVSYDESHKSTLDDEQWTNLKKLRAAIPSGAEMDQMLATISCDDCGEKKQLAFARVAWIVGEIEISIDVKL